MQSTRQLIVSIRRKLLRLREAVSHHGLSMTIRFLFEALVMRFSTEWVRNWRDRHFDSQYRVTTAGFLSLPELGGLSARQIEKSHNYRGTPVALFDAALTELRIDYKRFEFLDYGSGMGRAPLLAARYPFRRITGLEFSPELHKIAERNLAEWRLPRQQCSAVRSILADAATWSLPEGDCLLYFFNLFRPVLLRCVLKNIVLEASRNERQISIVYIHPSYPEVFDEFPELKSVARARILMSLYEIYKVEPFCA